MDSPLLNKYTKPKMRVINFSDVKVKEMQMMKKDLTLSKKLERTYKKM